MSDDVTGGRCLLQEAPVLRPGSGTLSGSNRLVRWADQVDVAVHSLKELDLTNFAFSHSKERPFSSVQGSICALGKAHIMRSTKSLRSFPDVAFETVPMFVWLTVALSRLFKEDRLAIDGIMSLVLCPRVECQALERFRLKINKSETRMTALQDSNTYKVKKNAVYYGKAQNGFCQALDNKTT